MVWHWCILTEIDCSICSSIFWAPQGPGWHCWQGEMVAEKTEEAKEKSEAVLDGGDRWGGMKRERGKEGERSRDDKGDCTWGDWIGCWGKKWALSTGLSHKCPDCAEEFQPTASLRMTEPPPSWCPYDSFYCYTSFFSLFFVSWPPLSVYSVLHCHIYLIKITINTNKKQEISVKVARWLENLVIAQK